MGAEVQLHSLVDLALRSPEAGVVNFNHLHTLLHSILNHIGLRCDPKPGFVTKSLVNETAKRSVKEIEREFTINNTSADKGDCSQGYALEEAGDQQHNQGIGRGQHIDLNSAELHRLENFMLAVNVHK